MKLRFFCLEAFSVSYSQNEDIEISGAKSAAIVIQVTIRELITYSSCVSPKHVKYQCHGIVIVIS